MAALLRAGPGAMAWRTTAAALDGLVEEPRTTATIHVLVAAERRVAVESSIALRRSRAAGQRAHPALDATTGPRIEETVLDLCAEQLGAGGCRGLGDPGGRAETDDAGAAAARPARPGRGTVGGRLLLAMLADVELGVHSRRWSWSTCGRWSGRTACHAGSRQQRVAGNGVRWVDVDHRGVRGADRAGRPPGARRRRALSAIGSGTTPRRWSGRGSAAIRCGPRCSSCPGELTAERGRSCCYAPAGTGRPRMQAGLLHPRPGREQPVGWPLRNRSWTGRTGRGAAYPRAAVTA